MLETKNIYVSLAQKKNERKKHLKHQKYCILGFVTAVVKKTTVCVCFCLDACMCVVFTKQSSAVNENGYWV